MGIVKRDSISITILSYVGAAIGYVNKILLFPNFLSEEQVGLTSILVSLAMIYAQLSALGINSTVVKFFPFFRTPDRRHNGLFFWSALGISFGFVLFTLLFLLFKEPVMNYFAKESPLLSEYYLLLIPLGLTTLFYNFFSSWLQAFFKTVISTAVYDVLLRLLMTLEISLYAFGLIDFEQFIVIYVLIYFVPTIILLLYTAWLRQISLRPAFTSRTRTLVAIAGTYGLWQYLGGASVYITNVIDQTMLAGIQGLVQGGIYSVMMYMVSAMMIPNRSVIKVSTPIVANLWKERAMARMQEMHREVSQMNLIIGCYIFLAIWINLDNIFSAITDNLPEAPAWFDKDVFTDKSLRFFASEIIREKILLYYSQEIPYSCEVSIESFKEGSERYDISAVIYVMRESQKGIVIGKGGQALKKVGTKARLDMEEFFQKKVFLSLFVKVDPDWRENKKELRRFGYETGA